VHALVRLALLSFVVVVFAGCSGGSASPPPFQSGTAAPTPVPTAAPTATPAPTPTPVPTIPPLNYFPFTNQASYEGGTPGGGYQNVFGPETAPSGPPSCAAPVAGNIGDYLAGSTWFPVMDHTVSNTAVARSGGQIPVYVFTKDGIGNVYIDGYYFGANQTKTCVTPYPFVKSQMKAGDSWVYTDINGHTDVATVAFVGQPSSFVVTGNGPHAGQVVTYQNVAKVNYGNAFAIYWSAGNGPVETENLVSSTTGQPNTWTAFAITVTPGSP
jgi:hypothetical protein